MTTAIFQEERHIAVVEDNPSIASLLSCALRAEGYLVTVYDDGLRAYKAITTSPPDLVLLDLDLPGMSGDEICRRLKGDVGTRLVPVVMVTAMSALQNKLAAWDYGADDFLPKPFHLVEVTARCRSLLRIKRLIEERDSAENVVFALARAVEAKSPYTHGHSERVMGYCLALADAIGLEGEHLEVLRKGDLLHDIGKISVPDSILNKPGKLTDNEYELIKLHPVQGAHIVAPLGSLKQAIPLIRWHHERPDGKGYPDGLTKDAIPHLVRILSVCDVYDSLSSQRPYRDSIPQPVCLEILRDTAQRGGLEPDLVDLFAKLMSKPHHPVYSGASAAVTLLSHDGA